MAPIKPDINRMSYMKWNKKKRIVTWTLTAEHGNLYFYVIRLNLEQHFPDYREKAFTYSSFFLNKLRVAGSWKCSRQKSENVKMNVIHRSPPFLCISDSRLPWELSGKLSAMSCCYFLIWPMCTWIDPVTRLGNSTDHHGGSYQPWNIDDFI